MVQFLSCLFGVKEMVHFAISPYTACGKMVVGQTMIWREELGDSFGYDVLGVTEHSCNPEEVTCDACKKSKIFTDFKIEG